MGKEGLLWNSIDKTKARVHHSNGNIYEGEVNCKNQPHGKGSKTFPSGLVMTGQWENGEPIDKIIYEHPGDSSSIVIHSRSGDDSDQMSVVLTEDREERQSSKDDEIESVFTSLTISNLLLNCKNEHKEILQVGKSYSQGTVANLISFGEDTSSKNLYKEYLEEVIHQLKSISITKQQEFQLQKHLPPIREANSEVSVRRITKRLREGSEDGNYSEDEENDQLRKKVKELEKQLDQQILDEICQNLTA